MAEYKHSIADLAPGDHLCCIYETEAEHRNLVTPYIRCGLERNERVLYIVDARTSEQILDYLRADGCAPEPFMASGQLVILTAAESYLKDGSFDPDVMIKVLREATALALADGFTALRITGEMTWACSGLPSCDRLIEYEAKLNKFFSGSRALAICQYDRRRFPADILNAVLDTHPMVVLGVEVVRNHFFVEPDVYLSTDNEEREFNGRMQALKRQLTVERQLELAVDNINEMIFSLDAEGMVTYVSPRCRDLFGYEPEDVIGQYFLNFMHPADVPFVAESYQEVMDGELHPSDYRVCTKKGEYVWVRSSSRPLFINGRVQGLYGVMTDISREVKQVAALKKSEALLEMVIDATTDGIWDWDLVSGAVKWSAHCFTMLGYEPDAFPVTFEVWESMINPDDKEQAVAGVAARLRNGSGFNIEFRFRTKDGGWKWILGRGKVVARNPDGTPARMVGTHVDIDAKKAVEEQLRASEYELRRAQEVAQIGSWHFELSSGQVKASLEARRIYGLTGAVWSIAEVQQVPLPEYRQALDDALRNLVRNGDDYNFDFKIRRPVDGVVRDIHSEAEFDRARNEVIGIIQDITERQDMEERLRHMQKMDAIGQLAGGVAHDFNNQLSGVLGYADLLHRRLRDPVELRFAEHILGAAKRAADLTAKLLAFSRKGQMKSVPVDINEIVSEVAEIIHHSVDKRITIDLCLDAEDAAVVGDPTLLQNALLNLSINARDAMPEGGVLSFITGVVALTEAECRGIHEELTAGQYLQVEVRDTGAGMTPEVLRHCFEPFFTTKEQGKGTGMGLAAVYGTVRSHAGCVVVRSEPGQGTVFRVYLPLQLGTELPEKSPAAEARTYSRARILVIDDEEIVRDLVEDMLTGFGHEVSVCVDGAAALDFYRRHWREIDLVICDLTMPRLNGRDTFLAMRGINPALKLLFASGYSMTVDIQEMLSQGVLGLLKKPFEQATLAAAVEAAMNAAPVPARH